MRIIRGVAAAQAGDRGAAAAMGNFDGVHRGHRAVLDAAHAAAPAAPLAVVTFSPHPRRFFAPDSAAFELTRLDAKARLLAALGVQRLFVVDFDAALSALDPATFCERVLAGAFGLAHVAVGPGFRFGARRSGDIETLRSEGARLGFGVSEAAMAADAQGPISSTAIRAALAEGRPEEAARMLGRAHSIEGVVEHGEKRGRTLGYPTANLSLDGLALPRFGVYAVSVDVLDGPRAGHYGGVASLGVRPMFGVNRPNLETFLFDFSGDLYGATLSVALVAFQRPELRFDGVPALVAQMDADAAQARCLLAAAA